MTKLTKLRIFLTLGALIGIAPVTYSFIGATLFLAVMLFKVPEFVVPVFLISTFGLWGCWKAYAAAMVREPKLPKDRRVMAAVIIALVWGLILAGGLGFASDCLGVFQYGLLHFGQTFGSPSASALGAQMCPHRSHFQPEICTLAIPRSISLPGFYFKVDRIIS